MQPTSPRFDIIFSKSAILCSNEFDSRYISSPNSLECPISAIQADIQSCAISQQMTSFINASLRGFAEGGLGGERTEEELEKAMQIYRDAYAVHYLEKTCIYEGLPEVLEKLKEGGARLAVYSNKMAEYVEKISLRLYGEGMFDILMGPDGIIPKPDPMGALIVAEKWGIDPSEIAYVGDSVTDMKTGLAAGMHTIGVSWGFTAREDLVNAGAHKIADTVDELGAVLASL